MVKKKRYQPSVKRNSKARAVRRGSRYVGKILVALFLIATGVGFFFVDYSALFIRIESRLSSWVHAGFAQMGFKLQIVHIDPMEYITPEEILQAAGVYRGQSLFSLNLEEVRHHIEKLPWVLSVVVQRQFPDALTIHVTERQPMAIWRSGSRSFVVDREGHRLADHVSDEFQHLPIISGAKAAVQGADLLEILSQYPDIRDRIKTAILISGRRWNLVLDQDILIKLPEKDLINAFAVLKRLEEKRFLTAASVRMIDLRVADRIVFRLIPEATVVLHNKGQTKEA